eukprot:TRINITY_DN8275_c0_g1_i1.p1 TRINITY_DN8275_c0_g1~~TRINITY_DN8275_c0_g1_i1.p1  ORF type:complete len:392 (+),score=144.63 TRINITY_DN8275_c0_g1_i1:48-1223(+)
MEARPPMKRAPERGRGRDRKRRKFLMTREQGLDMMVRTGSMLFKAIPGALTFDVTDGLKALLNKRVQKLDSATTLGIHGFMWEEISCRLMYQEGRLMKHGGKTGYEFSYNCRELDPITVAILDVIGYKHPKGKGFQDLQIVWNKYEVKPDHYCPLHRDYKGLDHIVYVIWGPAGGRFSFHNVNPPCGIVESANVRDTILYMWGGARHDFLHSVTDIGMGTGKVDDQVRYCMRIATVSEVADDVQQRKRLAFVEGDAPQIPVFVAGGLEAPPSLRATILKLEKAAARQRDKRRVFYLRSLNKLLDLVEMVKMRAQATQNTEGHDHIAALQQQWTTAQVVGAAEDVDALGTLCAEVVGELKAAPEGLLTDGLQAAVEAEEFALYEGLEGAEGQ